MPGMQRELVIVGAGIGGLASALAWTQARRGAALPAAELSGPITVLEQAQRFSEVGAGLQLGPNAVRVLTSWGLGSGLHDLAAHPQGLRVVDASDGRELARMTLGRQFRDRHGSDYLTIHRADLHGLLLQALEPGQVAMRSGVTVSAIDQTPQAVRVIQRDAADPLHTPALVVCDGVWSRMREQLLADGPACATGHLALRAMLDMTDLPEGVPRDQVNVWWGPRMHAVAYPVRSGRLMNLVVIVHETEVALPDPGVAQRWDIDAQDAASGLRMLLRGLDPALQDLVQAAPHWKLWRLHDRPPMDGPAQMAQGRVALLGDAAHPMRPYMAQGAAMAIEDAWVLARELHASPGDPASAFARYAGLRWQRVSRVQRKSRLNGRIFHAGGLMRAGRNLAVRLLGDRLLDTPWLYAHRLG